MGTIPDFGRPPRNSSLTDTRLRQNSANQLQIVFSDCSSLPKLNEAILSTIVESNFYQNRKE